MGRRVRGEGTIVHRKGGRYAAAISMRDGTRKWVYGHDTEEIRKKRDEVRAKVDGGLNIPRARLTVGVFLSAG